MVNLQKPTLPSFLIFVLLAIFTSQFTYAQNYKPVFRENSEKKSEKLGRGGINFSLPFRNIWSSNIQNISSVKSASDNDSSLLYSTILGRVSLINSETGRKNWESDLGGKVVSKSYVEADSLYIVTQSVSDSNAENIKNGIEKSFYIVRCLDKKTGLTNWQTRINSIKNIEKVFFSVYNSKLLIIDSEAHLISIDKNQGRIEWEKRLEFIFSISPFLTADEAIFGTDDGRILFVSLQDGNIVKTLKIADRVTSLYYNPEKKNLVWGNQKGTVSSLILDFKNLTTAGELRTQGKLLWKFRSGGAISDIILTPAGGILISSFDNFIYLISKEAGALIWKKRLGGRISTKPLVLDRYIIVTNISEPSASILELSGGKTVNKVSLPAENFFTDEPLIVGDKLILASQIGIYAFEMSGSNQ